MDFKSCSKCKEYLCEEDMFRKLKNGSYSKRCFNCSGRTNKEFMESMAKIFNPIEMQSLFYDGIEKYNNVVMVQ